MGISLLAALGALLLAPALPEGVTPLSKDMETRVEELLHEAETWRGLKAKEPVPSGTVDGQVLERKMLDAFREDLPPEVLRPVETGLKAFGLIPEDLDLVAYFPKLLSSQVAGYYDPERQYFALVEREELSADLSDEAKRLQDAVLVHELTHALQDQHFHLEAFAESRPLDDADVARVALIEGDATLVMIDFFAQANLETMPGADQMASMLNDPQQMLGSGVPGTAELVAAPAWFQDTLLFSYAQGFQFALSVRRKGGQELLDKAFTTDPPRSTEQILHPEKWHTKRDDPKAVDWPALPLSPRSGWKKVSEGQLGELSVRTLLRDVAKQDKNHAAGAAAGWGGDRFEVHEKEGRRLLVWISEWDSDKDAKELQAALRSLGRDWSVKRSGRRVVVTRGEVSRELRAALGKRT